MSVDPAFARVLRAADAYPAQLAKDGAGLIFARIPPHRHQEINGFTVRGHHVDLEPLMKVFEALGPFRYVPRYIFTAGYCGSTLISRCIDAMTGAMTITEPRVLDGWADRNGALDSVAQQRQWTRVLKLLVYALFRCGGPDDRVVVRGGEQLDAIMYELLGLHENARGLLLYSPLPVFLANTLACTARRAAVVEVMRSPQRKLVACRRGLPPVDLERLTPAQAITYLWLSEHASYENLCGRPEGARLRSLDFDSFVDDPERGLIRLAAHLELPLCKESRDAILRSDIFRTHAKASVAGGYGRDERQQTIAARQRRYAAEITEGLRWARALRGAPPPLALTHDLLTTDPFPLGEEAEQDK